MDTSDYGFLSYNLSIATEITGAERFPCDTGLPAGESPQQEAMPLELVTTGVAQSLVATGITAQADTTKANATVLDYGISNVTTVAGAADSVLLPAALAGRICYLSNAGANSMQVFGQGTDTINGVATGTGVAQGNGLSAVYFCVADGAWMRVLSA